MTPEERRYRELRRSVLGKGPYTAHDRNAFEGMYAAILDHYQEHEPAVADAIRYGLKSHPQAPFIKLPWPLVVDYPPGHPKA